MFNAEIFSLDKFRKKKQEEKSEQELITPDKIEEGPEIKKSEDEESLLEAEAKQEKNDGEALKKLRDNFEHPEKEKIREEYGEKRATTSKKLMALGAEATPFAGNILTIGKGLTGKDWITKEKLSGKERLFNVAVGTGCLVLDFVPIAGEAGEAARIAMVLGKGARIGKTMEKGIVAGRSVKGMKYLAESAAKTEKGKGFSKIFDRTVKLMEENPELVEKTEKVIDFRLKKYLKENNPTQKRIEELKDTKTIKLAKKSGLIDNGEENIEQRKAA